MAPRNKPIKDADVVLPERRIVKLESGTQVEILPLKTRQFFKLLRILTRGAGDALTSLRIDPNDNDAQFAVKLVATLGFAIPEAEEESIDFINSMVQPVGIIDRPASTLTEEDAERNVELWARVIDELGNPELGDTFSIIEAVVTQETPNLKALGKRLSQMFDLAKKTGKAPGDKTTSTE